MTKIEEDFYTAEDVLNKLDWVPTQENSWFVAHHLKIKAESMLGTKQYRLSSTKFNRLCGYLGAAFKSKSVPLGYLIKEVCAESDALTGQKFTTNIKRWVKDSGVSAGTVGMNQIDISQSELIKLVDYIKKYGNVKKPEENNVAQFKLEALRQRYQERSKYESQVQGLNLLLQEQAKVLRYTEEKLERQTELTNRLKDGKAAQEKHWRERYENLKRFTDNLVNVCVDEKISIAHVVSLEKV